MSVKRYELELYHCNGGEMLVSETGDYVSHDDYEELEQRLIESERYGRQTDITIDNLEMELAQMAAEVQAVRWACGQVYVRGYNHGHLNTVDGLPYADEKDLVIRGGETLYEFTDPDHCGVATDAILAELRAQGVEMFAKEMHADISGDDAREFAGQLRKGVQS
ncbi:hypothetical protein ACWKYH_06795 [Enterobacter sp. UPMP2076]